MSCRKTEMVARYVTQRPDVTLTLRLWDRRWQRQSRVDNLMATNCVGQRCQWPLLIITASVEMEAATGNY